MWCPDRARTRPPQAKFLTFRRCCRPRSLGGGAKHRRFAPSAALRRTAQAHISRALLRFRGVAQPGRAPALGAGCRRFESSRPDHAVHDEDAITMALARIYQPTKTAMQSGGGKTRPWVLD